MKQTIRLVVPVFAIISMPAIAYDVNDQLSIGGLLAGAIQCQNLSDAPGFEDTCEYAVPLQPEMRFRPNDTDEIFFKFGFAAGNGLNEVTPFKVSPWAASLESDVKNINGRNRDYLLTAWYKHTFKLSNANTIDATFGIIDSTQYLDENAYANNEYTQFMNAALTNGPNVFLPSYDIGASAVWSLRDWTFSGVVMDIGKNDEGNNTTFYGLQAEFHSYNHFGSGTYRIIISNTSKDFLNETGTELVKRNSVILSFDQAFGQVTGGWIRFGWRNDDAVANYQAIYSGGIDIKGSAWKRHGDNIGIGMAFLDGGNQNISETSLAEVYYRWQLNDVFALTADLQYQNDSYKTGEDPGGFIYGMRATAEF